MSRETIVIGIGGATCSGKTILAKHLVQIFDAPMLHQDDYAPPPDDIPYHPDHPSLQDWDDPSGAVLWPKFTSAIQEARKGNVPTLETREAKDVAVKVDEAVLEKWKERLGKWRDKVGWVVVDGFLMYWDVNVTAELDVRLFLRVPKETLQTRREGRSYLLEDGNTWTDPPGYFDTIVWPAYTKAQAHIPGALDTAQPTDGTNSPTVLTSSAIGHPTGETSTDDGEVQEESDPRARGVKILDVGDGAEEMTKAFEGACEEIERYLVARFGETA